MNSGFARLRKIQVLIFVFVLYILATSVTSTSATPNAQSITSTPATPTPQTLEGMRRVEMMTIAEPYATYKWVAANEQNRIHTSNIDPPNIT